MNCFQSRKFTCFYFVKYAAFEKLYRSFLAASFFFASKVSRASLFVFCGSNHTDTVKNQRFQFLNFRHIAKMHHSFLIDKGFEMIFIHILWI